MTRVYRILRRAYSKKPLDGEGAYLFGGRWSSPGTRLAYTAEHLSLAMLEYFVHIDSEDAPGDLVLVTAEIPDSVPRISIPVGQLPANWRSTPEPAELTLLGDGFVAQGRAAILIVPSALAPMESNWLINPRHSGFSRIKLHPPKGFAYDSRFFEK